MTRGRGRGNISSSGRGKQPLHQGYSNHCSEQAYMSPGGSQGSRPVVNRERDRSNTLSLGRRQSEGSHGQEQAGITPESGRVSQGFVGRGADARREGSLGDYPAELIPQSLQGNQEDEVETDKLRQTSSGGGASSSRVDKRPRMLVTVNSSGSRLVLSEVCSSGITKSFRLALEPDGINWKDISEYAKKIFWEEFEKDLYLDPTIDSQVRKFWRKKAGRRYSDYMNELKEKRNDLVPPYFVKEEVWKNWKKSWEYPKNKEKIEKIARNRRGGGDVAEATPRTHTGGSVTMDEHRRRYILKNSKEPTPSELHAYVHTHGNDGQNFVGSKPKQVNERYVEIVKEQRQSGSEVDELQAYYKAVGSEKKRRLYGLGDAAAHYYGDSLRGTSTSDHASSSSKNSQPSSTQQSDLAELVRQMMIALKAQFLPEVREDLR